MRHRYAALCSLTGDVLSVLRHLPANVCDFLAETLRLSKHNTVYFVVIRGMVPGLYTSRDDALKNVCDLPGAYVRAFTTQDAAIATWISALKSHQVFPLHTPLLAMPPFNLSRVPSTTNSHPRSDQSLCDTSTEHSFRSIYDGNDAAYFNMPSHEHGEKWVVWRGRRPGIFDTWPQAHDVVHGLEDPRSAYQGFQTFSLALSAWERLARDGYVSTELGHSGDPSDSEFEACTECGDGRNF